MQRARAGHAYYRFPESDTSKHATLVRRNMISLVAFDFVLGIIFRCVMGMTLVVEVAGMNLDDRPRYPARLGIPAHVIADFEPLRHITNPLFKGVNTVALDRLLELWVHRDRSTCKN